MHAGILELQDLPQKGNIDSKHTAGMFQFDVILKDGSTTETEPATHSHVAANPVAIEQSLHFVETHYAGAPAEIIDPYRKLGIKP